MMKMLHVTWTDHESNGGPNWESAEDQMAWAEEELPVGQTIGFLFHETPLYIVLTDTLLGDNTSACHKLCKQNIIEIKELYYDHIR